MPGGMLRELAWGRDGRQVVVTEPERSIGSQETFGADSDEVAVVRRELLRMADKTAGRMRKAGLVGRTVTISVRFADFADLTRSATLPSPTDVTERDLPGGSRTVRTAQLDRARIRRVGVRVEGLVAVEKACLQPTLIEPEHGWREADQAVDAALVRFGPGAVQRAVLTRRIARPPAPSWQPRSAMSDPAESRSGTRSDPDGTRCLREAEESARTSRERYHRRVSLDTRDTYTGVTNGVALGL